MTGGKLSKAVCISKEGRKILLNRSCFLNLCLTSSQFIPFAFLVRRLYIATFEWSPQEATGQFWRGVEWFLVWIGNQSLSVSQTLHYKKFFLRVYLVHTQDKKSVTLTSSRSVEQSSVSRLFFLKWQLRIVRSMSGCLFRGSGIKQLVVVNWLFLPHYSDVGSRTVYPRCTVYVLLKHFTQQVAHGLSNANAPSTITQGMTGKN